MLTPIEGISILASLSLMSCIVAIWVIRRFPKSFLICGGHLMMGILHFVLALSANND